MNSLVSPTSQPLKELKAELQHQLMPLRRSWLLHELNNFHKLQQVARNTWEPEQPLASESPATPLKAPPATLDLQSLQPMRTPSEKKEATLLQL
jgi:hypothetical protein